MTYEKKWESRPNHGAAFINREKKEDWHAEFRGDVMLPDGTLHYLDVRPATTRTGDPYYKIKIGAVKTPKATDAHNEAKSNGYQPQPQPQPDTDDVIPF